MAKQRRRYWHWRLATLVPSEKMYGKYRAAWSWVWMIGPLISIEARKGWTFGFFFYLFGILISRQATPDNMDCRFTGLELYYMPSRWIPSRIESGERIWRHQYRIGRYYSNR